MTTAVIIFAKAPVPGQSKTRLISLLGTRGAANAGAEIARQVLQSVAPLARETKKFQLSLWAASAHPTLAAWANQYGLGWGLQGQGDLGQRMHQSLAASLHQGAARVLLIGTDCPAMTADYLRDASAALQQADLVLGPAEDGGYVLIGCRAPQPELFDDVAWGTDEVLAQTLAKARALGLRVTLLAPLWDVDVPEDWQRYRQWRDE